MFKDCRRSSGRNYSPGTVRSYIHAVEDFARYFGRSRYRLGPDHIRQYQAYLFRGRKLLAGTIGIRTAALRFLLVKTLKRLYVHEQIPFPKRPRTLPTVLSQEEVERLIGSPERLPFSRWRQVFFFSKPPSTRSGQRRGHRMAGRFRSSAM